MRQKNANGVRYDTHHCRGHHKCQRTWGDRWCAFFWDCEVGLQWKRNRQREQKLHESIGQEK